MKIETIGPLLFWTIMFFLGAAIKFSAFNDTGAWINLAPEAALWGTGILFSLSVSEQTYSGARLIPKIKKFQQGDGYSVQYEVTIPDMPRFTSRYMYLFLLGMTFWIFCILLTGHIEEFNAATINGNQHIFFWKQVSFQVLSYILSASVVGAALMALYEVTR